MRHLRQAQAGPLRHPHRAQAEPLRHPHRQGGTTAPPAPGEGGTTAPPAPVTYTIGGTVSGLKGSGLVLQNNNGDDLAISANGRFTFATPIASGAKYAVTVKTPAGARHRPARSNSGNGGVTDANVESVDVICATNTYTIGGTVRDLTGSNLVLQNNGGNDELTISANGGFIFTKPIAIGAKYEVAVKTQPRNPTDRRRRPARSTAAKATDQCQCHQGRSHLHQQHLYHRRHRQRLAQVPMWS